MKPSSRLLILLFCGITTTRTVLAFSSSDAEESDIIFSALFSQKCLDVFRATGDRNGRVLQSECRIFHSGSRRSQLFRFQKLGSVYRIREETSVGGRCLGVKDGSSNSAAKVVTQTCIDASYQLWKVTKVGGVELTFEEESKSAADRRADGDVFEIRAMHTNQCLSVSGNSVLSGAAIIQFPCKTVGKNLDQLWDIQAPLGNTVNFPALPLGAGKWSEIIKMPIVAAAAANLPDGNILSWASYLRSAFGSGFPGQTVTSIFDPNTTLSTDMTVQDTNHDMFCPGTSVLPDGRVFITGGASSKRTTFYDPKTNSWSVGPELNKPRGYQGQTVLADGSVFLLGGSYSGETGGKYGEVWDPNTNDWTPMPNIQADGDVVTQDRRGAYRADNHMWLYLAPNGLIFHAGPAKRMHWIDVWSTPGGSIVPSELRSTTDRMNGCSVMFDNGKILVFGGAADYDSAPATTEAFVIDLNNDTNVTVTPTGSLNFPRVFGNAVVLPNGHVLAIGGQSSSIAFRDDLTQHCTEIWKPETGKWEQLENVDVPRNYHSVALLTQTGEVWSAGGGLCGKDCKANHWDAQIFTPPYLLDPVTDTKKVQPMILEAPAIIRAGDVFAVRMDTTLPHDFALTRFGAVTHSVDNDTRRIPLAVVSQSGDTFLLSVPANPNVSLAGSYHLFGLNPEGVPSIGHVLQLHPPIPPPTLEPSTPEIPIDTDNPDDNSATHPPPTPAPVTGFMPDSFIHINAGGVDDTTFQGIQWKADGEYAKGGNVGNFRNTGKVNTDADFLYQRERWGQCTYTVPVPTNAALYRVILHFAEVHVPNQVVGARLFDIDIEDGQATFTDVDIFAAVGANNPYILYADVVVDDGAITVALLSGARENPKISGLEVMLLNSTTPVLPSSKPPTPPPDFVEDTTLGGDEDVAYPIDVGSGSIESIFSGKCLDQDTRKGKFVSGGNVHQWDCHYRPNQQWKLWLHESGEYTIVLLHSNFCLSVKNAATFRTANVVQEPCVDGAKHQLWTISGSGDARELRVMHTGYCLALAGSAKAKEKNGANAIQFPCGDSPVTTEKKWKVGGLDP